MRARPCRPIRLHAPSTASAPPMATAGAAWVSSDTHGTPRRRTSASVFSDVGTHETLLSSPEPRRSTKRSSAYPPPRPCRSPPPSPIAPPRRRRGAPPPFLLLHGRRSSEERLCSCNAATAAGGRGGGRRRGGGLTRARVAAARATVRPLSAALLDRERRRGRRRRARRRAGVPRPKWARGEEAVAGAGGVDHLGAAQRRRHLDVERLRLFGRHEHAASRSQRHHDGLCAHLDDAPRRRLGLGERLGGHTRHQRRLRLVGTHDVAEREGLGQRRRRRRGRRVEDRQKAGGAAGAQRGDRRRHGHLELREQHTRAVGRRPPPRRRPRATRRPAR